MTVDIAIARIRLPIDDEEVPFTFEELFFSRTDWRGVILAGNSVFQRVSLYGWSELLQKPHNVIRHPDMPKGVFWLLWETLKRGEPIGAYVKNRAKDGRYYWVFAIVTPIEGGYLSVRLKPDSQLFKIIVDDYKYIQATTGNNKANAKLGAEILQQRLAALGFESYTAFMAAALSQEIIARNQRLAREPDAALDCFGELVTAAKSLLHQAELIFAAYARSEHVPINLRVQAAHLGQSGAVIDTISNNYHLISSEIRGNLNRLVASAADVRSTINEGLFLLCTATIQQETEEFFRREMIQATDMEQQAARQEMQVLETQRKAYQQKAIDGLRAINERIGSFRRDSIGMKRLTAGLEVTRIMGKMESARLATTQDGLDELIADLEAFQSTVANGLQEIDINNQHIQNNVGRLVEIVNRRALPK